MVRTRPAAASLDAVTRLGTAARLQWDLETLSDDDDRMLLAGLELQGLARHRRRQGAAATDELLRNLARRLTDAVRGSGAAYRIGPDRFAVLVSVGRGGSRAIVLAATAALCDADAGVTAQPTTTIVPSQLIAPQAALRLLHDERAPSGDEPTRAAPRALRPKEHAHAGGGATRKRQAGVVALRDTGVAGDHVAAREREVPGPTFRGDASAAGQRLPDAPLSLAQARGAQRHPPLRGAGSAPYLRVATRFRLTILLGLAWMALSTWLARPWISQLGGAVTLPAAIAIVAGVALVPGYLNVQLVASLLLDRPPPLRLDVRSPGLTLLIAAYNEAATITQTIAYALAQDYPGPLHVVVVDDGSSDDTAALARGFARVDDRVQALTLPHGGKAAALNAGLRGCETPLVATIDADTLLMPGALRRIVARMLSAPQDTVAVAGSVLVRNSRAGLLARAQVWDYFLGIGSIKRQQALWQATLVAQGAFSVYDAAALRRAGGWPDCIGEDIVMTWALLDQGGRTTFEPTAVAFTEAPVTLRALARQRRRWARGMIEGLRRYGVALVRRRTTYTHGVLADAVFPYLDLCFTFAFLPGIVLAAFGDFAIVGPMTLAVLPINGLLAGIMYRRQRGSLTEAGLSVRRGLLGFVVFLLLYQAFMSPVSVSGYVEEMLHVRRRW